MANNEKGIGKPKVGKNAVSGHRGVSPGEGASRSGLTQGPRGAREDGELGKASQGAKDQSLCLMPWANARSRTTIGPALCPGLGAPGLLDLFAY